MALPPLPPPPPMLCRKAPGENARPVLMSSPAPIRERSPPSPPLPPVPPMATLPLQLDSDEPVNVRLALLPPLPPPPPTDWSWMPGEKRPLVSIREKRRDVTSTIPPEPPSPALPPMATSPLKLSLSLIEAPGATLTPPVPPPPPIDCSRIPLENGVLMSSDCTPSRPVKTSPSKARLTSPPSPPFAADPPTATDALRLG